jgi:hypothetical protein
MVIPKLRWKINLFRKGRYVSEGPNLDDDKKKQAMIIRILLKLLEWKQSVEQIIVVIPFKKCHCYSYVTLQYKTVIILQAV